MNIFCAILGSLPARRQTKYGALLKLYITFETIFLKIFNAMSVKPENSFCVILKRNLENMSH